MIKLYGLRMSNYYSLVKALMVEKGVPFEEVKAPPTQQEDNLLRSPMGKMPAIEVDGRYLSESLAIALYLERIAPQPSLLPQDPLAAAKVMELVCHIKLDIELVARRCLPEALFGQAVSAETRETTRVDLERGMQAVSRLLVCDPYIAGSELTLADFYAFYCFGLANVIAAKLFNIDLLAQHAHLQELLTRLAQHPSISQVESDKAA